jgi:hypothetical protein
MMTRTIQTALNNSFGARADAVAEQFEASLAEVNRNAVTFRRELIDSMEFGTYVIAGAIVLGMCLAAVIYRTGN